jgi:hypothetical protein
MNDTNDDIVRGGFITPPEGLMPIRGGFIQPPLPKPSHTRAAFKLICASKCKRHALEMAKQIRPANKFTRVSEDFLVACEANLRAFIANRVRSHPSIGKTLT